MGFTYDDESVFTGTVSDSDSMFGEARATDKDAYLRILAIDSACKDDAQDASLVNSDQSAAPRYGPARRLAARPLHGAEHPLSGQFNAPAWRPANRIRNKVLCSYADRRMSTVPRRARLAKPD